MPSIQPTCASISNSFNPTQHPSYHPSALPTTPSLLRPTFQPTFSLFAPRASNNSNSNSSSPNASLAIAVITSLTSNLASLTVVTEDVRVVAQNVQFVPSGTSGGSSTLNVQLPLTPAEIALQQAGLLVTSVPTINLNVAGGVLRNTSSGNGSSGGSGTNSSVYVAVALLNNTLWPTQSPRNTSQPSPGQLLSGGAGFVEGTGSVAAGVVLGLVTSDLSKTFQASTAFGDGSAASKGAVEKVSPLQTASDTTNATNLVQRNSWIKFLSRLAKVIAGKRKEERERKSKVMPAAASQREDKDRSNVELLEQYVEPMVAANDFIKDSSSAFRLSEPTSSPVDLTRSEIAPKSFHRHLPASLVQSRASVGLSSYPSSKEVQLKDGMYELERKIAAYRQDLLSCSSSNADKSQFLNLPARNRRNEFTMRDVINATLTDIERATKKLASQTNFDVNPRSKQTSFKELNAPAYLFVSNQLADMYPSMIESQLVKAYKSVLPTREVSCEWQKLWHRKAKQYGKVPESPVKSSSNAPTKQLSWVFWIISLPKRFLLHVVLHVVIAAPIHVQSICIRVAEPAVLSGMLLLFLQLIEHPVYLAIMCLMVFAVFAALLWDYVNGGKDSKVDSEEGVAGDAVDREVEVAIPSASSLWKDATQDNPHRAEDSSSSKSPANSLRSNSIGRRLSSLSFNSYSMVSSYSSYRTVQSGQSLDPSMSAASSCDTLLSVPSILYGISPALSTTSRKRFRSTSSTGSDGMFLPLNSITVQGEHYDYGESSDDEFAYKGARRRRDSSSPYTLLSSDSVSSESESSDSDSGVH
eukprot:gene31189-37696_t